MNYKNDWLSACFGSGVPGTLINVKFRGREVADFPRGSFDNLKTDPACEWITDAESGEILYYKD